MAKTKISEFSPTPANNTDIDNINIAEGCAPSGINDAIRELMSQLKDFQAGTAGDSFNGPIGTTTAAAGAFTTLSASGTTTLSGLTASTALALDASKNVVSVTNTGTGNNVLATSPTLVTPALGTPSALVGTNITGTAANFNINGTVGATTPATGAFTTLTTSSTVTINGGTANGVAYLNDSKVLTTGSGLTFDGTNFTNTAGTVTGAGFTSRATGGEGGQISLQNPTNTGSVATFDVSSATTARLFTEVNNASLLIGQLTGTGGTVAFHTAASERMRIDASGNVGIGTSSPSSYNKLSVVTTTDKDGVAVVFDSGPSGSNGGALNFWNRHNSGVSKQGAIYTIITDGASSGSSKMTFNTSYLGTLSEKMVLTTLGNLGIGTSSPTTRLQLAKANTTTGLGNGGLLTLENTDGGAFDQRAEILFKNVGQVTSAISSSYTGFAAGPQYAGALIFATKGTTDSAIVERMRIDASGNLGLGVTPSAWNSDYKAIQLGANGGIAGRVGGSNSTDVVSNTFRDSGGAWRYIASSGVSRYTIDGSTSAHIWYNAPSGTAGNTITFTQAMTLFASGGLSVGTTTDPSAGNVTVGSNKYFGQDTNAKYIPDDAAVGGALYTGGGFRFFTGGANERMRIDSSGNVLVGGTSTLGGAKQTIYSPDLSLYNGLSIRNGTAHPAGAGAFIGFYNSANATAGFINQTGTTTVAYTTSSDYRLKENVQPMMGALAKIAALKPVTYRWKDDQSASEGFIAHELAEVCPQAVVGEKDAVDADGNPKYQGIDTSFLVATLTAAIQEQQAIIESLKARLDAANL